MKKYRLFIALCVVLLIVSMVPVASAESVFRSDVKAALLLEKNSGQVLYEYDADERNYPASLTKIMTCLLALENGNLDDVVTVTPTALQDLDAAGSSAGLLPGEELTLLELLYCVMISSANEACNVVAEYVSGSVPAFVELMNARAAELGCLDTHFANPHGLHDENHYSTARDLSLIAMEAIKHDIFCEITNTSYYQLAATNLHEERNLYTTNQLIVESGTNPFYYSKASGIKTGFTTPAGRCLISTADNGNLQTLAVVMGAETELNETETEWVQRSFPECINLFEYGFKNFKIETVLTTLYPVAEIPVNMAATSETVALAPVEELRSLVPMEFDVNELTVEVQLNADSVDAPVEAGTVLGSITVLMDGEPLGTTQIAAITSVARSEITHHTAEAGRYIRNNWWKWVLGLLFAAILLLIVLIIAFRVRQRMYRKKRIAERREVLERRRQIHRLEGE